MKFLETQFDEYISSVKKKNMHPLLEKKYKYFPNDIYKLRHIIFYGPPGVGKYSQALYNIRKYSPTELKYERKMNIGTEKSKDKSYNIKISDIHFEVDMNLLGCNAKALWNDLYYHILDIISTRQRPVGIIICKNFHKIHSELLDVFYSYMQTLIHKNIHLTYILLTEHLSFLPFNILQRARYIPFVRPTKIMYNKSIQKKTKQKDMSLIRNIKNLHVNVTQLIKPHSFISEKIIKSIENYNELNYLTFRETIYELFIYNIDIGESIWYILSHFLKTKKLTQRDLCFIFMKLYIFFKFFNNNYRPIYHLENFMIYLCKIVHEL